MPTRSHVHRRLVSGTAAALALDTEGGRAFLQMRLAIWARIGFLITFSSYVLEELLPWVSAGGVRHADVRLLHLTVVLLWGATWLVLRRGALPRTALGAIDAAIVLVGCSVTALYIVLDDPIQYYTYLPALVVFVGSVGRAIFVPSTARCTALVSLGVAVGALAVGGGLAPSPDVSGVLPFEEMRSWSFVFALTAVVLATVASRVIYGLRQEIRKALQLGQYTLEEKLGEGGMGTVYRARHAMLRRPTAVKLLPPEKVGEGSLERFEREVQATALLSHPNTVAIFDYGHTPDGIFYYAMEYLDGVDLETLVRAHGPQPPARVVHILRQACGSLGEAHESGLIHRDVKPANIILCERGGAPDVAKVVDFGLVKDLEESHGITKADTLTGTPLYLAPEAIRGEEVDGRSDLYALGAVGYYLLVGRDVFEGKTLVEICGHHLHAVPTPPSERRGQAVPPKLEAAILSCLEKDPSRRPASARDLLRALVECDDVGEWGEERARAWWAEHGGSTRTDSPAGEHGTLTPSLEWREPAASPGGEPPRD